MVKDVYYCTGISCELALKMGFNWHYLSINYLLSYELSIKEGGSLSYRGMDDKT